jgi:nucleoside-diphosphate-sugar epimerase
MLVRGITPNGLPNAHDRLERTKNKLFADTINQIMGQSRALVTGASGYIGLHVVSLLLQQGWAVHAAVRNLDESNWQPLANLRDKNPGRLRIFEADLLRPASFTEPMQDCSVVLHVASPFLLPEVVKEPQKELVDPAVQGTRNVLDCVNKTESVQRVVLTSSGNRPRDGDLLES